GIEEDLHRGPLSVFIGSTAAPPLSPAFHPGPRARRPPPRPHAPPPPRPPPRAPRPEHPRVAGDASEDVDRTRGTALVALADGRRSEEDAERPARRPVPKI